MGGGQRTQTGGTQTLLCALPQQMGKSKYATCFLVNQSMKLNVGETKKDPSIGIRARVHLLCAAAPFGIFI